MRTPGLLVAVLAVAACGDPPDPTELDLSRDRWQTASQGTSYTYVRERSSWLPSGRTTVSVADGVVYRRSYEDPAGGSWTETGDQLGSHDGGFPAVTLDRLYDQCGDDVLSLDPGENDIYFELDDRGFLKDCYDVPHACEEDCVEGIEITALTFDERCLDDC